MVGMSGSAQEREFQTLAPDNLWTSTYIRKEFIQRWVADLIGLACAVSQSTDVADAMFQLEQKFGIRDVKGSLAAAAIVLRSTGSLNNTKGAAEEIARVAVRFLQRFDARAPKMVANKCRCEIGDMKINVDYNTLLRDLAHFLEDFGTPRLDCQINQFLKLNRPNGDVKRLLSSEEALKLQACKELEEIRAAAKKITCIECRRIGDAVIALEQPPSWMLVHVDNAFNVLCPLLGNQNAQLVSVTAAQKAQTAKENTE